MNIHEARTPSISRLACHSSDDDHHHSSSNSSSKYYYVMTSMRRAATTKHASNITTQVTMPTTHTTIALSHSGTPSCSACRSSASSWPSLSFIYRLTTRLLCVGYDFQPRHPNRQTSFPDLQSNSASRIAKAVVLGVLPSFMKGASKDPGPDGKPPPASKRDVLVT